MSSSNSCDTSLVATPVSRQLGGLRVPSNLEDPLFFFKRLCKWCDKKVSPADCWATVGETTWCDCGKQI